MNRVVPAHVQTCHRQHFQGGGDEGHSLLCHLPLVLLRPGALAATFNSLSLGPALWVSWFIAASALVGDGAAASAGAVPGLVTVCDYRCPWFPLVSPPPLVQPFRCSLSVRCPSSVRCLVHEEVLRVLCCLWSKS